MNAIWTDPSTSINRSLVHLAAYIDGREVAYLQILRRRGHGGRLNISGHVRHHMPSGWIKATLPPQPTIPDAVAALEALGAPPMPPATLAALMAAHAAL